MIADMARRTLTPNHPTHSKVAERLEFLAGAEVEVRVAYIEAASNQTETFRATYEDCVPMGREYFYLFGVSGKTRLVRTSSVIEIKEL